MCDVGGDDGPSALSGVWRTARKPHRCYACRETIHPGHRYRYTSGIWDGTPHSFKHCARCWTMIDRLEEWSGEGVRYDLNCGEVYEGDDPEMLALAFMTADEAQAIGAGRGS